MAGTGVNRSAAMLTDPNDMGPMEDLLERRILFRRGSTNKRDCTHGWSKTGMSRGQSLHLADHQSLKTSIREERFHLRLFAQARYMEMIIRQPGSYNGTVQIHGIDTCQNGFAHAFSSPIGKNLIERKIR